MSKPVAMSRCEDFIPNDVVEYIDANTKEVVHIDLFFNTQYPAGYNNPRLDAKGELKF